ncbi:hypothetical protein EYF80_010029 [Liparis tanakae]|uniref:Uncharacterized protein n=1 Tax=Liparis tanakae TaxID=230148 RepID=A0A4Z2IP26_9TELE|nr:hypothetical protein EYF80_010029 [Liparis tanakae]
MEVQLCGGALTLSRRHRGDLAGVGRMAADPGIGDGSRTGAVLMCVRSSRCPSRAWCCSGAALADVTVLQTHRPALLPADVGGVEVLDGQTLLLHDTPATVGVVGQQAGVAVWVLLAFGHGPLLQLEPGQHNHDQSGKHGRTKLPEI